MLRAVAGFDINSSGAVIGPTPAASTNNAAVVWDGTTGRLVKDSKVVITPVASGSTFTLANGKTLVVSNTLTLAGTDGTTMTFPGVSASLIGGPASSTDNALVRWDGTTGRLVKDSNWQVDSSGNLVAAVDNVSDFGLNGSKRPRNGYFSGQVSSQTFQTLTNGSFINASGGLFYWTTRAVMSSPADGLVAMTNNAQNAGAAIVLLERTAPSAPPANTVYIYSQDNGAGKTQLMALFPTGSAQEIAIEPP